MKTITTLTLIYFLPTYQQQSSDTPGKYTASPESPFKAGNSHNCEVEMRTSDASVGLPLFNDGEGQYAEVAPEDSGFNANLDARAPGLFRSSQDKTSAVVAHNNGPIQTYEVKAKHFEI